MCLNEETGATWLEFDRACVVRNRERHIKGLKRRAAKLARAGHSIDALHAEREITRLRKLNVEGRGRTTHRHNGSDHP